jgi:hypothetical protein
LRLTPLDSGRATEIDMIEREMEGGVVVVQPLDVYEHTSESLGGLIGIEERVEVHELEPRPVAAPRARGPARRGPC